MSPVRIAVAGAGLIGKRHVEEVDASPDAELASIVDPGPVGPELAEKFRVPLYQSLAELFERDKPDGVILATPNQMHVDGGLECVAAGVPVIVEKPIGDTVEGATRLVEAGEQSGVPVLTGHHRNYSPVMATAREIVHSGRLGPIVAVVGHGPVLQARRLLRRQRRLAAPTRWWADPAQPHPRGEQPALPRRRHRPGPGGDLQRHPLLPGRGHRGHGVHVRRTARSARSCSPTPPRQPARGSRPHRRTPATPATTTKTAITSRARPARCPCRPCGSRPIPAPAPGGNRSTPRPRLWSAATRSPTR